MIDSFNSSTREHAVGSTNLKQKMNESNWALKNRRGLYAHPSWCEKAAKKKQKDRAQQQIQYRR